MVSFAVDGGNFVHQNTKEPDVKAIITTKYYRCAPEGHTTHIYRKGEIVRGIVAEWAVRDKAAEPVSRPPKPPGPEAVSKPEPEVEPKPAKKPKKAPENKNQGPAPENK